MKDRFRFYLGDETISTPGLPDETLIFDSLTGKPVVLMPGPYANMICLEHKEHGMPLTDLVDWMNQVSDESLASEGIPVPVPLTVDQVVDAEEYAEESMRHYGEKLDSLSNINTFARLARFQGFNFTNEQIKIAHGVILRVYCRSIGRA